VSGFSEYTLATITNSLSVSAGWQWYALDLPIGPTTDRVEVMFGGIADSLYVRNIRMDELPPATNAVRAPTLEHYHRLTVAPNPTTRWVRARADAPIQSTHVFDASGRKIEVDDAPPSGVYLVRYRLADGCVVSRKVTVIR
jgi:hypothetical protein